MDIVTLFPFIIILFYLIIIGSILYLIYSWVRKFISLREEQNELLREVIRKLDEK